MKFRHFIKDESGVIAAIAMMALCIFIMAWSYSMIMRCGDNCIATANQVQKEKTE